MPQAITPMNGLECGIPRIVVTGPGPEFLILEDYIPHTGLCKTCESKPLG